MMRSAAKKSKAKAGWRSMAPGDARRGGCARGSVPPAGPDRLRRALRSGKHLPVVAGWSKRRPGPFRSGMDRELPAGMAQIVAPLV